MGLNHQLARKRSSSSFRGRQSEAGSTPPSSRTASDEKPREAKSTPYKRPSYETVLATKGSFMGKFDLGITDASKTLCRTLLEAEQSDPQDTLFHDGRFDETCESVRARNEAMVVRDISPLVCLCPSAEDLWRNTSQGFKESVNEGWNCANPFTLLAHNLIILRGSDGLRSWTIKSKSLSLSWGRFQILLRPISWLLGRCTSPF